MDQDSLKKSDRHDAENEELDPVTRLIQLQEHVDELVGQLADPSRSASNVMEDCVEMFERIGKEQHSAFTVRQTKAKGNLTLENECLRLELALAKQIQQLSDALSMRDNLDMKEETKADKRKIKELESQVQENVRKFKKSVHDFKEERSQWQKRERELMETIEKGNKERQDLSKRLDKAAVEDEGQKSVIENLSTAYSVVMKKSTDFDRTKRDSVWPILRRSLLDEARHKICLKIRSKENDIYDRFSGKNDDSQVVQYVVESLGGNTLSKAAIKLAFDRGNPVRIEGNSAAHPPLKKPELREAISAAGERDWMALEELFRYVFPED